MSPNPALLTWPYSSPLADLTLEYVGTANLSTDGTTYTFSGRAIGDAAADRTLILAIGAGGSVAQSEITGVTVGGSAATIDVSHEYNNAVWGTVGFARIAYPTGTTADIAVTLSTSTTRCAIGVYRVTGGAVAVSDTQTGGVSGPPASVTTSCPSGGFVVAASAKYSGNTPDDATWTGVAEDWDTGRIEFGAFSGGSTSTPGSVTPSVSSVWSGQITIAAVAYEPA